MQLAIAVEDVINKSSETLKYDIQHAKNLAMDNERRTLRGREVVWMVFDYFKTHKSLQTYYSYQDLIALKWKGDEKLEEFYREWLHLVANIREKMDPRMLME
eukprot:10503478-Alexandrium_andersonii.AAC.1